ncbi:unnamed protein product [Lampetra planeri]
MATATSGCHSSRSWATSAGPSSSLASSGTRATQQQQAHGNCHEWLLQQQKLGHLCWPQQQPRLNQRHLDHSQQQQQ